MLVVNITQLNHLKAIKALKKCSYFFLGIFHCNCDIGSHLSCTFAAVITDYRAGLQTVVTIWCASNLIGRNVWGLFRKRMYTRARDSEVCVEYVVNRKGIRVALVLRPYDKSREDKQKTRIVAINYVQRSVDIFCFRSRTASSPFADSWAMLNSLSRSLISARDIWDLPCLFSLFLSLFFYFPRSFRNCLM